MLFPWRESKFLVWIRTSLAPFWPHRNISFHNGQWIWSAYGADFFSDPPCNCKPIDNKTMQWLTILESCSTSARALRTSRSKSMAFCQALWATVTRPPQPGPPHFFSPSSVLQLGPPHSLSEQSAPGGVPQVCNKPRVRQRGSGLVSNGTAGWPENTGGPQQRYLKSV